MQLKVHRGTHQIGGCITEVRTEKARIIIDMGAELPHSGENQSAPPMIDGVTQGIPDCDGVFITHYHGDHAGMFEAVLPSIPIYMGEAARKIYAVVQNTLKNKFDQGDPERVNKFHTFTAGKAIVIKDIKITPYTIDHSAYDAYMLLIEAEGKRILHTGDFRMHGARGGGMPAVFAKYARDVDVLVTEGTMLSRMNEEVFTEHELGRRASELMRKNKFVFVLCSSTNIDTIAELYHAANKNHRLFIVCEDNYQAEILRIVSAYAKSPFYDFTKKKYYVYGDNLHDFMNQRGFCFVGRVNYTTERALKKFPNSVLVYSMWRGYLDKSLAAYDEFKTAFIERAGESGAQLEFLHTSGHASVEAIKRVCELTRAKTVVPIHCERPEALLGLRIESEIKLLNDGEELTV